MLDSRLHLRRKVRPAALAAMLCHAGMASALGFGAIHVHSALNEPLDATINLVSLTPDEKSALDVGMASLDMFQRFGIERSAIADRVRISTSDGNEPSQVLLRLTTTSPVREPFLRFLIEADTGAGRALREYTILLDPPGRAPAAPAVTRAAEAPTMDAPAPSETIPSEPTASAASASPRKPAPAMAGASGYPASNRYGPVEQGETLSRIATTLRRPGTSLDQIQVAIYRDNPQAFNDNMNILLRGAMLTIPPVERIRAINDDEARSTVREQHLDAVSRIATSTQANTLAETTAPPATTDASLRLEAPQGDGGGSFGNSAVGSAGFGRLTLPDFNAVADGDAISDENNAADSETPQAPQAVDPMVSTGHQTEPAKAVEVAATDAPAALDTGAKDVATQNGDAPEAATVADPQNSSPGAQQSVDDADSSNDDAADGGYQPLPSEDVDVIGSGGGQSSLLRPRNLLLLAGGLLLVVLLIVRNRRRQYQPVPLNFDLDGKDDQDDENTTPDAGDAPVGDEPPVEATVYDKPGAYAGRGDADPSPELCVQEADRQMRLGLFEEARETLETGLALEPSNTALQDKRLEFDYVSGDADAFVADIERFGGPLADDGVRWAGIASMGRVLLPDDPRFSYPTTTQLEPVSEPEPETPQALFDSFAAGGEDVADELAPSASTATARPYFSIDDEAADTDPVESDGRGPTGGLPDVPPIWVESGDHATGDNHFQWQDEDSAPEQKPALDPRDADDSGFEFDVGVTTDPEQPRAPVTPIDTTEFDLDDGADADEASDDADSVEVRLDLARMYIDMEDSDTARELLEEAAREGDEAQRATAEELLATL